MNTMNQNSNAPSRYPVTAIRAQSSANPVARHLCTINERMHGLYGPEVIATTYALDGLDPERLAAVVANPEALPAYILALAPDPEQALHKHAQAVRRGHL